MSYPSWASLWPSLTCHLQRVDQLTGTVCSMSMEEQKAGLKLHTLAIELDGKQGQISTLIESNKEVMLHSVLGLLAAAWTYV